MVYLLGISFADNPHGGFMRKIALVVFFIMIAIPALVAAPSMTYAAGNPFSQNASDYAVSIDADGSTADSDGVPFIFYGKLADVAYADLPVIDKIEFMWGDMPMTAEFQADQHIAVLFKMTGNDQTTSVPSKDGICTPHPSLGNAFRCVLIMTTPPTAILGQPGLLKGLTVDQIIDIYEPKNNLSFAFAFRDKDGNESPSFSLKELAENSSDSDSDDVPNTYDNCSDIANYDQKDTDKNGAGDLCDEGEASGECASNPRKEGCDPDGDGIKGPADNCPTVAETYDPDTHEPLDGVADGCPNSAAASQNAGPGINFVTSSGGKCSMTENAVYDGIVVFGVVVAFMVVLAGGISYRFALKARVHRHAYDERFNIRTGRRHRRSS
jgi:hypothetical protein